MAYQTPKADGSTTTHAQIASIGQYVVCGHGEDADYGRVIDVDGRTMVAWLGAGSDQRTPYAADSDDLVCDTEAAARAAWEVRS